MKKRNIVHSALSLSLTAALCLSMAACGGTQTPADSAAASQPAAPSAAVQPSAAETTSAALPVKALNPKQVEENPYMAKSDANIHHDGYNTDSTDEILPLAIYPEINVSYETTNANASPAIYFDSYGHAVVPLLGGIAIRDLNAEETKTLGYFSPKKHDGGGYVIQSSYNGPAVLHRDGGHRWNRRDGILLLFQRQRYAGCRESLCQTGTKTETVSGHLRGHPQL